MARTSGTWRKRIRRQKMEIRSILFRRLREGACPGAEAPGSGDAAKLRPTKRGRRARVRAGDGLGGWAETEEATASRLSPRRPPRRAAATGEGNLEGRRKACPR